MKTEPDLEYPSERKALPPEETFRLLFLDSEHRVDRLKETCRQVGYVVVGATTIEEAMAFLEGKNHADVIVCGAHLEDQSVFSFLHRVRTDVRHRRSMFLILSLEPGASGARLDRTSARAAIVLGADAYVVMPLFDPDLLVSQIRELQPRVPALLDAGPAERQRSE